MSKSYVLLGSHSGIARELSELLARRGEELVLVARSAEELALQAVDLRIRFGTAVHEIAADALDPKAMRDLPAQCVAALGGRAPHAVILCWGVMFAQEEAEVSPEQIRTLFEVNLTSAAVVLQGYANRMNADGIIAGVSSVAGDRGRGSNYLYGATKAGLNALLDGMRHRFRKTGPHVLTVKPGFVATPMTEGIVDPDSPLCASPEQVAADILRAMDRRQSTLYTLWPWRWVMAIIKALPESFFLRTKL